jgi:3-phosphoshikimate 1-carboxyvinyltransferase
MTTAGYPSEILIERWTSPPPRTTTRVPGSKSLTNRALAVAAMARGPSILRGALDCEDTQVMVAALRNIGIDIKHDTASALITVQGCSGVIPSRHASLGVANSGTSLRFLTAILSTGRGTFQLDGSPRMRERPISDLLDALNGLGSRAKSDLGTGCPPVTIEASGLEGGSVFVRGDVSSQFLSGLLIALPAAKDPTRVQVDGVLVSQPYVAMTLAVMESFGVTAANRAFRRFDVPTAAYMGRDYVIEPDASAASYFFALAAITGGAITVEGLGTSSIQGDMAFVDVLEQMGCTVKREPSRTTVIAGPLHAVDVDMNAFSDTVMTLAVVALFVRGVTRIHNVAHIRHKETDRIAALAAELRKLGARVDEFADGLVIDPAHPDRLHGERIHAYNDHRMAMSFALAGLKIPDVTILDPGCVKKTYPDFWADLEALRAGARLNRPEPSAPA